MADDHEYEAGTDLDPEAVAFAERELAEAGKGRRTTAPDPDDDDDPPRRVAATVEDTDPPQTDDDDPPQLDAKQELALKMGWAPRDQWRGAPDAWVDAEAFIERASPRMLLERIDKLTKEHDATFQRVEKANKAIFERQKQEHEAHIASLKRQRDVNVAREAIANGEEAAAELGEKWDAHIDKEAAKPIEAEAPAPAPAAPAQQQMAPETAAWVAKHPHYKTDQEFGGAAFWAMDKIHKEMGDKPMAEQFAELDRRMAKRFPEYYPQAKPNAASTAPPAGVRTMDGVRVAPKKDTNYASKLPASARKIAENMVKRGEIKSVETYAKEFFSE